MLSTVARHTSFQFCLVPTAEQEAALLRHTGAARFAFNQCLRVVKSALDCRHVDSETTVPWSRFDLINHFNSWKKTEAAGRVFVVDTGGAATVCVTGLPWRGQVCQQVFEEGAVDCARALDAWKASQSGMRRGRRVGFPKFKKKTSTIPSFRLRNKHSKGQPPLIRVGTSDRPRSVTLPKVGAIAVHDNTRRLRRMLATGRARILFATISQRAGRWWVSLNVEAADLHSSKHHDKRDPADADGWVGIDRGLAAFVVAADRHGNTLAREDNPPRSLATNLRRERRLQRSLSRKRKGSKNSQRSARRLARHHGHVRNIRRHYLHQVSNKLVKNHDRLVLEDLNIAGMMRNHCLARAIGDAGWAELARMIEYKSAWRGGEVMFADRWFPSSRICSLCGVHNANLTLADRIFACECGYRIDRDLNGAANLAAWGEEQRRKQSREHEARAPVTNAR